MLMIINTLAAMCAGFVLNLMVGTPPGWLDPKRLISSFAAGLEKLLRRFYEESSEALRMAGGVMVFFTLVVFAGVPLALVIVGYKLLPVVGLILDCFFCWTAFSMRNERQALSQIMRGVRSGNLERARKILSSLTNEDCSELDKDGIVKKAVECAADTTADNGAAVLFFMFLGGGFGGMFYRSVSILNGLIGKKNEQYIDFGKPARNVWKVLMFIPSRIAAFFTKLDVSFLRLDSENCKKICRRDRKKLSDKNLAACRCAFAGALDIQLTKEEYFDGELMRNRYIGGQLKECRHEDIYWAIQLMYGCVFGCLLLFSIIRAALFFIL